MNPTSPVRAPQDKADVDNFVLKFHPVYFGAVPHMWDQANGKIAKEIQVQQLALVNHNGEWHYLNNDGEFERRADWVFLEDSGEKRWAFKQLSPHGLNDIENADLNNAFACFVENLATYCQQDPILCDEHGYVLDGYARLLACRELKLTPKYQIVGNLPDDAAKVSYIRSRKLAKHNVPESQRMQIVKDEIKTYPRRTIRWTAELLGVASNTVRKYRRSLEKDGLIEEVEKLLDKNGKEHDYKPAQKSSKPPKNADEKAKDKTESILRQAKKVLAEKLLDVGTLGQSLANIDKFLKDIKDISGYENVVDSLKATFKKVAPPIHDSDLEATQIGTSLKRIDGFIKGTEKVPSYHQGTLREIRQAIDNLLPPEASKTTTVGTVATALWNAHTVSLLETKTGLVIKLKPAHFPGQVDVLEGVIPGPVFFGGKTINLETTKALLLLPTEEAPKEDDLLFEKGTVNPSLAVG